MHPAFHILHQSYIQKKVLQPKQEALLIFSLFSLCASLHIINKQAFAKRRKPHKYGILVNGLGIVRSVDFYNKDYLDSHPDIVVEKKSKSPDEDKSLADSKALLPTLKDFKFRHPDVNPEIFLGDAAFDTIEIYKSLFEDFNFKKAFIPLKVKLSMNNIDYTFNENGIPCCPHDPSLPMKREGSKSHLKSNLPTMKFVCPKMKWEYNREDKSKRRVCHCDNPCTTSSCGRMIYVYPEKNLRAYQFNKV